MAASVEDILSAQTTTAAEFESGAGLTIALRRQSPPSIRCMAPNFITNPLQTIKNGNTPTVAILVGSNTHETTLWGYGRVDESKLQRAAEEYGVTEQLEIYRNNRPEADAAQLLVALTSDHMFRIPCIRLAEAQLQHTTNVWMYLFNWKSRAFEGRLGDTARIPLLLITLIAPEWTPFLVQDQHHNRLQTPCTRLGAHS